MSYEDDRSLAKVGYRILSYKDFCILHYVDYRNVSYVYAYNIIYAVAESINNHQRPIVSEDNIYLQTQRRHYVYQVVDNIIA